MKCQFPAAFSLTKNSIVNKHKKNLKYKIIWVRWKTNKPHHKQHQKKYAKIKTVPFFGCVLLLEVDGSVNGSQREKNYWGNLWWQGGKK